MVKKINEFLSEYKYVLFITLVVKLILILIGYYTNRNPDSHFINNWVRWDGPHYVDIAKNWYQTTGDPLNFIVFYPLYPILIRIFGFIFNDLNFSSIFLSTLLAFLVSVLLYKVALFDLKKKEALLSVWFLNIFPTSYFLQASYTESLFLSTSLFCIFLFRQKKPYAAGIFGFLSALSRINGLLLIPYFAAEKFIVDNKLSNPFKFFWGKFEHLVIASSITIQGFFIYLIINFLIFGEYFYFTKPLSEHWFKKFEWPWQGVKNIYNFATFQKGEYFYLFWGELIAIFFTLGVAIYVFFKIRKSYGIYMLFNLGLFTSTSFIMSTPRYIVILFPIYLALAKLPFKVVYPLSIIFLALLGFLTHEYTVGRWAY